MLRRSVIARERGCEASSPPRGEQAGGAASPSLGARPPYPDPLPRWGEGDPPLRGLELFHTLESGRSSNHLFSSGAQAMKQWLLDAPLSRHMTLLFLDAP